MVRQTSKKPDRREIGFSKSTAAQTKKPKGIKPEHPEKPRSAPILGQSGGGKKRMR
jgi:hypothetical protein